MLKCVGAFHICYNMNMLNPEIAKIPQERVTLSSEITLDQLLNRLSDGKVPIGEYGKGNAKTINHLLAEVNEGEAVVTIDSHGAVYRELNVLCVDVLCELSNGNVYHLREDRQEFKDGRTKKRQIDSSIGEKLKPSESAEDAVQRALSEELGVNEYQSLYSAGYSERTFIPDAFPGIESTYKMHRYVSFIPETGFIPEGYVEYQADKTNYYVWERINNSEAGSGNIPNHTPIQQ